MRAMSTKVRRLLELILLGLLSSTPGFVRAVDVPPLTGYVNDFASMLSDAARERVDAKLAQFHASKGPQLVVLTVPDLQGASVEDFALKVATTWQLGDARRDDGMLLLIAKREHRVRIEVGYGLEGQIPDAAAARIIRTFLTRVLQRGDYDLAVESACDVLMAQAVSPSTPGAHGKPARAGSERTTARSDAVDFMAVVRWFIAIFLGLGFLASAFRKRRPGESTSLSFSRSSSSRESGGVVSSSSGGSSSVSGSGGGFGGGGASGSW